MTENYYTRLLDQSDCKKIVNVHMAAFSSFFLTTLGPKFLFYFYKSIINNKDGLAIGIFEKNNLVGFVVGSYYQKGFYKKILFNNFFSLSFSALLPLLKKPYAVFRIISSFFSPNININQSGGVLLSICINPSIQGKGIGNILINEFEKKLKEKNIFIYYLTTDKENNDKVNLFYLKAGFQLYASCRTKYGRPMNIYYKNINSIK